ncbi:MAG: NAD(P)H-hydrate dehydratase [Hyphomicrobiales bacterium]|nr:NAD(P)H-hydrate dehydratase [Hyphomicrobiales bacterium]MDE2115609.1 NAD(P)H-hydrate dehydratase [Hyphomicrobiales bacterium]
MNAHSELLTVAEMARADHLATTFGISVAQLMENAGKSVAQEIQKRWKPCPTLVLCGPGNNGGDGFVAARYLAKAGWPVRIALLGARESLKGEARQNARLWQAPIEVLSVDVIGGAELIVDALFGAGLSRPLDDTCQKTLIAASGGHVPIVAIDVPSGIMGDTGESLGAVPCALTVTFFRKKPGHLLQPARTLCGEAVVTDIGIPDAVLADIQANTFENLPKVWARQLPQPGVGGHKYNRGHALISGGYPMTGAARLCALAAARAGAGLTTIAVPEIAFAIYAGALTSTMVHRVGQEADFLTLLHDRRISATLIGPGAGATPETRARVLAILATGKPAVLDADAITVFQGDAGALGSAISGPCILTPHEGEFRRLFQRSGDKLASARAAAGSIGAIIVLKGSDTVIAAPDGRAIVNANAPPSLATAGSGDVLSGILLGLLTQGMEPFLAAAAAVWMHGEAANLFGAGLIAEDIIVQLPKVIQNLAAVPSLG